MSDQDTSSKPEDRSVADVGPKAERGQCRRRQLVVGGGMIVLVWMLMLATAGAHTELERSVPVDESTVSTPVEVIELWFVRPVEAESATAAVVVAGATVPAQIAAGSNERVLLVRPDQPITAGEAAVAVAVVARDGHSIEAGVRFFVDVPILSTTVPSTTTSVAPTSSPSTTATTSVAPTTTIASSRVDRGASGTDEDDLVVAFDILDDRGVGRLDSGKTIAQGIAYAATILAVGLTVFNRVVDTGPGTQRDPAVAASAGVVVIASVAWASLHAAIVAGGDSSVLTAPTAWAASLDGRLELGIWLRVAGATLLLAAAILPIGLVRQARLIASVAIVGSYGLIGHNTGALESAAAVVHVTAVAIWIGGLFGLVRALRRDRPRRIGLLRRFSRLAAWTLVATAVAGTALAVSRLDAVGALWSTTYGRLLAAKLAVVAVIVGLGAVNRRAIDRSDADADATIAHVRRIGSCELVAAVVAVALTAELVASA